jgi:SAM-dependent methyltransferase
MELLIGCGSRREKAIRGLGQDKGWTKLVTLDNNTAHNPDVLWDLNEWPLPFSDNTFDEIHAYEVLEHLGEQGDYYGFFKEWFEYWRILKPGGLFHATVPSFGSPWAWGDPSHTRIITAGTLVFLSQAAYEAQVGKTAMSDFRDLWKGDFELVYSEDDGNTFAFVLMAVKGGNDG